MLKNLRWFLNSLKIFKNLLKLGISLIKRFLGSPGDNFKCSCVFKCIWFKLLLHNFNLQLYMQLIKDMYSQCFCLRHLIKHTNFLRTQKYSWHLTSYIKWKTFIPKFSLHISHDRMFVSYEPCLLYVIEKFYLSQLPK